MAHFNAVVGGSRVESEKLGRPLLGEVCRRNSGEAFAAMWLWSPTPRVMPRVFPQLCIGLAWTDLSRSRKPQAHARPHSGLYGGSAPTLFNG